MTLRTSLCLLTLSTFNCAIMDRLSWLVWMLTLPCLLSIDSFALNITRYGHVVPDSSTVEIGKNFTATCVLNDKAAAATSEDLYWTLDWSLDSHVVPAERYTRVNSSALSVIITASSKEQEWLICRCRKYLPMPSLEQPYSIQGIVLTKAYFPEKPENLSCLAPQAGQRVSPVLSCTWSPGLRDTGSTYVLHAKPDILELVSGGAESSHGSVQFDTYPNNFVLDVWVEVKNVLGKVESDHLIQESETFVKPNPPFNVTLISEKSLSRSLLLNWTRPINKAYLLLMYQVRYCPAGSMQWTQVLQDDISKDIQSFRLQSLLSDTEYVAQVRCQGNGPTYWSDWSRNATARTPEDKPTSKADLWRIIRTDGSTRSVQLLCKPPLQANGRIRNYLLKVQKGEKQEDWRTVLPNGSESDANPAADREVADLGELTLMETENAVVKAVAQNAAGKSPEGRLIVLRPGHEPYGVQAVQCTSRQGKLWVEWLPPVAVPHHDVTEYLVEWLSISNNRLDWQREGAGTNSTSVKGNLEKYKLYSIQVYPLYRGKPGRPSSCQAYLEEAAPSAAPLPHAAKRGSTEVVLQWQEIPLDQRRGFITNYTLFVTGAAGTQVIPLSSSTYSHRVTHLERDTKYVAHLMASNSMGSYNGTLFSFTTDLYGGWEFEGIVVGSCFLFLAVILIMMLICVSRRDVMRKAFWPQVPDPSESTIAAWSPDFPSKAASPKESVLGDLSVVEVEAFGDGGSLYEDERTGLALKEKDLSGREHSSGFGGSSCISSPRQSVSDSEEGDGGGSGQTTGSTVQYSSVVASSGYKGQSPPAPCFARSESTQPLLEGEEQPPETPVHAQPRNPYFKRSLGDAEAEREGGAASLTFGPAEKKGCQLATPIEEEGPSEWQVPGSNYRSQASGYRPQ